MTITKHQIYLFAAGLTLALVGGYISFNPMGYLNQFGIDSIYNINFYSDLRSMGGSLLVFGFVSIAGGLVKQMQTQALFMTTIVFISYSFFRLMAFALDGTPSTAILIAAAIEICFALIGATLMTKQQTALAVA